MECIVLLVGVALAGSWAGAVAQRQQEHLIGAEPCTWGPSYWCSRINNSASCGAFEHCSQSVWSQEDEPVQDHSASCTGCDAVVETLKYARRHNMSSIQTMSVVRRACNREFAQYPEHLHLCLNTLGFHLMKEAQFLLNSNVPDRTICALMDLCQFDTFQEDMQEPSYEITGAAGRDICQDCVNFMQDVHDMYLSGILQEVLTQYLEMQCDKLPAAKEECKEQARANVAELFTYMRQHFVPAQVCKTIKMCGPGGISLDTTLPYELRIEDLKEALRMIPNWMKYQQLAMGAGSSVRYSSGNAECMLCEWAVQIVDRQLSDNATQQEMEHALQQVCTFIPARYRANCVSVMVQYGPEIIQALSQSLDPELVCESAGACMSSAEEMLMALATDECEECKQMAAQMIDVLKSPDGQREIENFMESFCRYLPSSYQQQCDSFVENLVPELITYLLATVTPMQMCQYFKIC